VDVTDRVETGEPDAEWVPLRRCICGFEPDYWAVVLSQNAEHPTPCPACGRRYYVAIQVRVYEVVAEV
jgi:hypothetical protein